MYSTASTDEAVYIIGGDQNSDSIELSYLSAAKWSHLSSSVAIFKNDVWKRLGDLTQARHLHGSISINQQIMVVGGYTGERTKFRYTNYA